MRRFVPHPVLSLVLLGLWVVLTRPSPGHLILGSVIGLLAGWAVAVLEIKGPLPRRLDNMVRLAAVVGWDIIRSNGAVAWLILSGGRGGRRRSGFVEIPLRLTDKRGLALLAVIITATPGTAWIDYDPEGNVLLLHVFDLVDEEGWRAIIRNRYEALLVEIFP